MSTSLLEFILKLLGDDEAKAAFEANPAQTLQSEGLEDLCAEDVAEARPLVVDNRSVDIKGSFDRSFAGHDHGIVVLPPPDPAAPGESDLDAVVREINYITENYAYTDDHSTTLDNSVNQQIWNKGLLLQTFDNDPTVASGEGAIAAGDDIEDSTLTTGDHNTVVSGDENTVGDGNVDGDFNDVANGDGSAAGEGNLVNNGDNNANGDGNVTGSFGEGAQTATNGGEIDNSIEDSYNTEDSHDDNSAHDSFNSEDDHSVDASTDDSYNSEDDNSVNDSLNSEDDHSTNDSYNPVDDHSTNDSLNDSLNSEDDHSVEQDGVLNVVV